MQKRSNVGIIINAYINIDNRMAETRTNLEGSLRLERIKNIKLYAFLAQWLIFIFLAVFIIYTEGINPDPLFLPLDGALYFLFIMFIVMIMEAVAFTYLEIRLEPSYSSKFLMAKSASQRAIAYIILAVVVMAILLPPPVVGFVEGLSDESGTARHGETVTFTTLNFIGTSYAQNVKLTISQNEAEVFVVEKEIFDDIGFNYDRLMLKNVADGHELTPGNPVEATMDSHTQEEYVIVIYSSSAPVDYEISYTMSQTFRFTLPILSLVIAVANLAWYIFLIPLKKKFRSLSIYA